jgi:hypothetical protein
MLQAIWENECGGYYFGLCSLPSVFSASLPMEDMYLCVHYIYMCIYIYIYPNWEDYRFESGYYVPCTFLTTGLC